MSKRSSGLTGARIGIFGMGPIGCSVMLPALAAGAAAGLADKNTEMIGTALYQQFMLPVEIASILLLVAMVGAVIMAKRRME